MADSAKVHLRADTLALEPPADRSPLPRPESMSEDLPQLAELARFLNRHHRWILVSAIVAGIATYLWTALLTPAIYEASATLVLMPPRLTSQLKPQLMSIQGFQRLLESDAVIDQTRRNLLEAGILQKTDKELELGENLMSRIYVSRRSEETSIAPVIELVARNSTPEKVASIANTWATIFLEQSHELLTGSTSANIALVETQFESNSDELRKLDQERLHLQEMYQDQLLRKQLDWSRKIHSEETKWDRTILELRQDTENQLAGFQLATRREMENFASSHGLTVSETDTPNGSETQHRAEVSQALEAQLLKLMTLRIQIAQTRQYLTLEKAVSNDVLWQATVLSQGGILDFQPLTNPTLITQEINPEYADLAKRLSEAQLALESFDDEDLRKARNIASGMEKVQRDRSAGFSNLVEQRAQSLREAQNQKSRDLEDLRMQRKQELAALDSQQTTGLADINRRLTYASQLFDELAERSKQAELARGQEDLADVRLGASAIQPLHPLSKHLPVKITLAVFFGALFGALIALYKTAAESSRK